MKGLKHPYFSAGYARDWLYRTLAKMVGPGIFRDDVSADRDALRRHLGQRTTVKGRTPQ
jgi:hypothetical protein